MMNWFKNLIARIRNPEDPRAVALAEDIAYLRRLGQKARMAHRVVDERDFAKMKPESMSALRSGLDIVGYVFVTGCDMFHILGRFWPGPDFGRYEKLLREQFRATTEDTDDRDGLWEQVDSLGLVLDGSELGAGTGIRDFHLESDNVFCKAGVPVEFKFRG